MEIVILNVTCLLILVFIILLYKEVLSINRLIVNRTFPLWKPGTCPPVSKPVGHEKVKRDIMKSGIKNPMVLPKSDEKLAELEHTHEKNAGSLFGSI